MTTTALELYDQTRESIAFEVDNASADLPLEHSGQWVDLVVWNIVAAFLIGVASNATFAWIRDRISRSGHLDRQDIEVHIRELKETEIRISLSDSKKSRELITGVLSSFLPRERIKDVVDRVARILETAAIRSRDDQ